MITNENLEELRVALKKEVDAFSKALENPITIDDIRNNTVKTDDPSEILEGIEAFKLTIAVVCGQEGLV